MQLNHGEGRLWFKFAERKVSVELCLLRARWALVGMRWDQCGGVCVGVWVRCVCVCVCG